MNPTNPLVQLQQYGQSPWYDYISRSLIESGGLLEMVKNDGLLGVTSNPSIFDKAIGGSADYDVYFKKVMGQVSGVKEIYEAVVIRDIQDATDILLPVYERTGGRDGFVSLEVAPNLAYNTEGTIAEALRLHQAVNRKNVMIKVPATEEGVPAIAYLLEAGININITLLFGVDAYEKVAKAYISALTNRVKAGLEIGAIASVASFFISRIDSLVDSEIEAALAKTSDPKIKESLSSLFGKVATANARIAYWKFQEMFEAPSFLALAEKGAQVQRLLWASTGTKNPKYSDDYYVEGLIAPMTVNTLPAATFDSYKDHGKASGQFMAGLEEAEKTMALLAALGINIQSVTNKLITDGVKLFENSFDHLIATIGQKQVDLLGEAQSRQTYALGSLTSPVEDRLKKMGATQFVQKFWSKDPTLWHKDPVHQKVIQNAMGWIDITKQGMHPLARIKQLSESIRAEGFQSIVLLGMGGSSLAPEVLKQVFGSAKGGSSSPDFFVLDSTVPAAIKLLEDKIDPSKTLFIVSSKSGSTIEPLVFFQYFFDKVKKVQGENACKHFVAITDPNSLLEKIAKEKQFREIFPGVAEIGGRYSALSNFGIVPGGLIGIDIETLLLRADQMRQSCTSEILPEGNPGVRLGAVMGEMALLGKDKITFISGQSVKSLGAWVEQLIAESTGKAGKGITPIDDEPVGAVSAYGADRLFIHTRDLHAIDSNQEAFIAALQSAGHPVVTIELSKLIHIGEAFFLWEIATAVSGSILGINPFDQPNVQESKDYTNGFLDLYRKGEAPKQESPLLKIGPFQIWGDNRLEWGGASATGITMDAVLAAHFSRIKEGDYAAINAYLERTDAIYNSLQAIRAEIRNKKQVATTLGFGPRFLHSTGQLHKGGGNTGLFLQITSDDQTDLSIPGELFTFGQLKNAQSLGDYTCLINRDRRVLRVHITGSLSEGLNLLVKAVKGALSK